VRTTEPDKNASHPVVVGIGSDEAKALARSAAINWREMERWLRRIEETPFREHRKIAVRLYHQEGYHSAHREHHSALQMIIARELEMRLSQQERRLKKLEDHIDSITNVSGSEASSKRILEEMTAFTSPASKTLH
jgi:hypothetical protein